MRSNASRSTRTSPPEGGPLSERWARVARSPSSDSIAKPTRGPWSRSSSVVKRRRRAAALGQAAKGGRLARAGPGLYEQSRRHRTSMMRRALNSLLYFPDRRSGRRPRRPDSSTATSRSRPRTASGCTAGWWRRRAGARPHAAVPRQRGKRRRSGSARGASVEGRLRRAAVRLPRLRSQHRARARRAPIGTPARPERRSPRKRP